jgi:hypothetical protein
MDQCHRVWIVLTIFEYINFITASILIILSSSILAIRARLNKSHIDNNISATRFTIIFIISTLAWFGIAARAYLWQYSITTLSRFRQLAFTFVTGNILWASITIYMNGGFVLNEKILNTEIHKFNVRSIFE